MIVVAAERRASQEWEMYYDDEGSESPVPWWFNSVTGESTWERPIHDNVSSSVSIQEGQGKQKQQRQLVSSASTKVGAVFASSWSTQWSEEHQVKQLLISIRYIIHVVLIA